jgi:S-adenosylmethionine:tRNA ribosyltransferase-isomerase
MTKYNLSDFDFELPESKIAVFPAEPRDSSKLLVNREGNLTDHIFKNIVDTVPDNSVFILNDTKVMKARLNFAIGQKLVEVFFIEEVDKDIYLVMVKPGKLFKVGFEFDLPGGVRALVETILEDGTRHIKVLSKDFCLQDYLGSHGSIPLPPYINQDDPSAYEVQYQTVYAKNFGSVAAPTAGLHFTPELIAKLEAKGCKFVYVTLNVGIGTFQPVRVEDISQHVMHSEFFEMSSENALVLNRLKQEEAFFIAVGTTTLRVLQSSFDFKKGFFLARSAKTNIFISPGYDSFVVDALITNFHLPKSTLFILVSAIIGLEQALESYNYAIDNDYRFYSFGDANFIYIPEKAKFES